MSAPDWWRATEELFDERPGTPFDDTGGDAKREYVRKFRMMVNSPLVDQVTVGFGPGIPRPYSPMQRADGFIVDPLALLLRISADMEVKDDWQSWIVICFYSTKVPPGGPRPGSANKPGHSDKPESDPPDVEWDSEVIRMALQYDSEGKAFLNSAQQPFTPAPTFEVGFRVAMISRNELQYDNDKAEEYQFAVNKDDFRGKKPGQCLMYPWKAKKIYKGPYEYWRITYKIRFITHWKNLPGNLVLRTWQPRFLDAGLNELRLKFFFGAAGPAIPIPKMVLVPIYNKMGQPISQPVCLDGAGKEAKPDLVTGKVLPTWLTFKTHLEQPFKPLNLEGLL